MLRRWRANEKNATYPPSGTKGPAPKADADSAEAKRDAYDDRIDAELKDLDG